MARIRLAVIGCGKVSERFHLPVTAGSPRFALQALVDRDLPRAQRLAAQFEVPTVVERIGDLAGRVDAAIVATPHHLHHEIGAELLRQGIHVLVEKPMAVDVAGCDRMIEAAAANGATLAVGLVRRFYPASRFIKDVLDDGMLGPIHGFDAREGAIFGWQVVSDATFRRDQGGGVLSDIGSHVLDLLSWWLGDPAHFSYADDAMGGVEAECEIGLTMPNGVTGTVELSRTRLLRNTIQIWGERGRIEVGPSFDADVRLAVGRRGGHLSGSASYPPEPRARRLEDVFAVQLADFARAIDSGEPAAVTGAEGRRSIAHVEACRSVRQPLELPWMPPVAPRGKTPEEAP